MKKAFGITVGIWACLALWAPVFGQQDYPTKPVSFIHGFTAGGSTDLGVRVLGEALSGYFKQPFVTVPKPGGAEGIGVAFLARSAPDGYTIAQFYQIAFSQTPYTGVDMPFKLEDVTPVIGWLLNTGVLVCKSDAPFKNLKELIAAAKIKSMSCGYNGTKGSGTSLRTLYFIKQAGIKVSDVPFKGDSEQIAALMGGHIQLASMSYGGAVPLIDSGQLRALAIFTKERSASHPNIPTFEEQGFPNPFGYTIGMIFVPKKTPEVIVKKLHDAIKTVSQTPKVKADITKLDMFVVYYNPKEMIDLIEKEKKVTIPFLREIGLTK